MKKIYLDFDKKFLNDKLKENHYVITNNYYKEGVLNINREFNSRDKIFADFLESFKELDSDINFNGVEKKMHWFKNFFLPLSQWIITIEKAIVKYDISENDKVVFTSYSKNKKVFLFEAEGEVNKQFLYHGSFFLTYYIKMYLKNKGFTNIDILRTRTFQANISYYIRGFLVVSVKSLQLLFYKLFIFKRKFTNEIDKNFNNNIIVLTRGIIQTQFIEGLNKLYGNYFTIIVNESSSKPFRNLREARGVIQNFVYAEGALSYKSLLSELILVLKAYFKPYSESFMYFGIPMNTRCLESETAVINFNKRTYAKSVKQILEMKKYGFSRKLRKIISFEMLSPCAYYLAEFTNLKVDQVQTAAIFEAKYPNFAYSGKFYFNNKFTYQNHAIINAHMQGKIDYLHNIKFLGLKKKMSRNRFKTLTYFTQPIFLEEERKIIIFLQDFCKQMKFQFKIKLHPRSPMPDIDLSMIEVIKGVTSSQQVVNYSDIVVTRNSSIGSDAWFLNTPVLFFVYGTLKGKEMNYIPQNYMGTINKKISLDELKSQFPLILEDFYNHSLHNEYVIEEKDIIKKLLGINFNMLNKK